MELMAWFVEGMQECFSERLGQYTTDWFKVATSPGSRFSRNGNTGIVSAVSSC